MRAMLLATAIAATAGVACAQDNVSSPIGTPGVTKPPPVAAAPNARQQAEDAVKAALGNPDGAKFRREGVMVATSVKQGLDITVPGPVSIVCGQYSLALPGGGYSTYAWFFVPIKAGKVLWSDLDRADDPGVAYGSCQSAGLAS